jgi:hypothetical protein
MLNEALLCLTKNAVYLGAANWADALCHATTRVRNLYGSFEITLLFALYAVSVTLICLCHISISNLRLGSSLLGTPVGAWIKDYPCARSNTRSFRAHFALICPKPHLWGGFERKSSFNYAWPYHSGPESAKSGRILSIKEK